MSYKFKTEIANKANYGGYRTKAQIKYLVIHYTANDGDTDEANAKYFQTHIVKASAHYFVDDDSVTQSVDDMSVAYSVGGNRYSDYKTTGGAKYYGLCTNTNSISVEMCDCLKNGKNDVTEKTLNNTIELCQKLIKKYDIDIDHVIRHFDVTGKQCPKYFVTDTAAWGSFKSKLFAVCPYVCPIATIKKTSQANDIKWLQWKLNKKADAGLTVDGVYGEKTRQAVLAYWKSLGWNKSGDSDGWAAGKKTIIKLSE